MRSLLTLSCCLLITSTLVGATPSFEAPFSVWGVDEALPDKKPEKRAKKTSLSTGKRVCCSMIRFFQNQISPIDGPRSSYYPSSSNYTLEAIKKYGVLQGIALGCDRLMRENKDLWVYETMIIEEGLERKKDLVR